VKTDNGPEPGGFHPGDLCGREGSAPPVIAGHLSRGELFLPEFLEPLFGAETLIAFPFLGELSGEFAVEGYSLGLPVRS
jgi:hypothetical protein